MQPIPVYILTGFLGSGKTTLLQRLIKQLESSGKKPVLIMNEVGEANIDGLLVPPTVPMQEMLGGCICCSVGADLSGAIVSLAQEHKPDVIIIEATGIASPMEIIQNATEASLITKIALRMLVTVIDGVLLHRMLVEGNARTRRLMEEQIRCAGWLVLNKCDLLDAEEVVQLEQHIRTLNRFAPLVTTSYSEDALGFLEPSLQIAAYDETEQALADCETDTNAQEEGSVFKVIGSSASSSRWHGHVMAYTHYYDAPPERSRFEAMMRNLPQAVYRAKGLLHFAGEEGTYLFQYAYRELDIMKVSPQVAMPDVAVFIGENFVQTEVAEAAEKAVPAPIDKDSVPYDVKQGGD